MKVSFRQAHPSDINTLLRLMREYYALDGIRLRPAAARARLRRFLADPGLGKAWLAVDAAGEVIGYAVLTKGYGLEHGPNVTIDELYFRAAHRGAGAGARALRFLEKAARSWGAESVHAEVERNNARAMRFWNKNGFHAHDRYPLVKMLDGGTRRGN